MEKKKFVRKQERFVLFLMLLLLFPLGALAQQKLIKGPVSYTHLIHSLFSRSARLSMTLLLSEELGVVYDASCFPFRSKQ